MSTMFYYNVTAIVLQITIIISFITVFFFLYGTYIEKQIVISQVNNSIDDLSKDFLLLLSPDEQSKVREVFQNINEPSDLDEQDAKVKENNDKLITKSSIIISCLFFTGICITIYLIVGLKLNAWYVIKNSLFGIGACVLTEYIFITYFAANYKSLDPNVIKLNITNNLIEYANS